jgi:hypothetical protein
MCGRRYGHVRSFFDGWAASSSSGGSRLGAEEVAALLGSLLGGAEVRLSHLCAWIGSLCLRRCVHGIASIAAALGGGEAGGGRTDGAAVQAGRPGDGLNNAPCPPFTSHGASIMLQ